MIPSVGTTRWGVVAGGKHMHQNALQWKWKKKHVDIHTRMWRINLNRYPSGVATTTHGHRASAPYAARPINHAPGTRIKLPGVGFASANTTEHYVSISVRLLFVLVPRARDKTRACVCLCLYVFPRLESHFLLRGSVYKIAPVRWRRQSERVRTTEREKTIIVFNRAGLRREVCRRLRGLFSRNDPERQEIYRTLHMVEKKKNRKTKSTLFCGQ